MGHASSQFAGTLHTIVVGAVALALAPGIFSWRVAAQGRHSLPEEHQLKAAFVYNLIPFVEWPPEKTGGPLVVGFAGEGPMEAALRSFLKEQGTRAPGVEMRVVHGRNDLRACQVLFLAYPDSTRMREALAQLQGASVLTIGDGQEFVRMGGVVGFEAQGNKLRLLVNPGAAQRARLKISAKLLSMSTAVTDDWEAKD
jgi:hypothetical protein